MKELKSSRLLKIFLIIYGLLYIVAIVEPVFSSSQWQPKVSLTETVTVITCFLLYLTGATLAWYNKKIAGVILMLQHFLVWFFALAVWPARDGGGGVVIMVFPVLIMAAFLYRNWFVENTERYQTNPKARLLLLDVLLVNYSIIYFSMVFLGVLQRASQFQIFALSHNRIFYENIDYLSLSGGLLIIALIIYAISIIIVKQKRMIAGILLLVWYVILVALSFTDQSFSRTGPWVILGLTVLFNAIYYIIESLHYKKVTLS